jgi:hypothetical protein
MERLGESRLLQAAQIAQRMPEGDEWPYCVPEKDLWEGFKHPTTGRTMVIPAAKKDMYGIGIYGGTCQ